MSDYDYGPLKVTVSDPVIVACFKAKEAEVARLSAEVDKWKLRWDDMKASVEARALAAEREVERLTKEREDYREKRANEVEVMRQARDLFRDQRDEAMKSMVAAERARDEAVAALRDLTARVTDPDLFAGVFGARAMYQAAVSRARAVLEGGR